MGRSHAIAACWTAILGALVLIGAHWAPSHGQGFFEDVLSSPVALDITAPTPLGKVPVDDTEEEDCKTSCSLKNHPIAPFRVADFQRALADYAESSPTQASAGLDTLLFYGATTETYLGGFGSGPLSPEHLRFLRRELARTGARVSLRLIDEAGETHVATGEMNVPIGNKQHLHPAINSVQPLEFNGTVMRVGLHYLWSRF